MLSNYKKFEQIEGELIEILLFGNVIKHLNINEAAYILNENNYKQNLNDFRNGFQKANEIILENYEVYGVFSEEFKEFKKDWKEWKKVKNNVIMGNMKITNKIDPKDIIIEVPKRNDLHGKLRTTIEIKKK